MGSGVVRDGGEGEGEGCWRPAFGGRGIVLFG